ncbi:MAG: hypothetical protein DRQ44_17940 [Gammaproteobacteria bacterium]|nr:MAG: hypothetical protein DRQ44_17940 [Gammaproteobacteria bacterium]
MMGGRIRASWNTTSKIRNYKTLGYDLLDLLDAKFAENPAKDGGERRSENQTNTDENHIHFSSAPTNQNFPATSGQVATDCAARKAKNDRTPP